ncbi:MAG: putative quinol monooxygenase [Erythrobacter sp.]
MLIVLATARLGDGALAQGREAIAEMVAASNAEPGCIAYAFAQDLVDPDVIHIVEKWQDSDALAAHFATPHMAAFRQALAGLDFQLIQVRKFETDEGQPLG